MQQRPLVIVFYQLRGQLGELDRLSRTLYSMQRELTRFAAEYYQRILPLCERLERARSGLDGDMETAVHLSSEEIPTSLLHEQMKELYRKLVKRYHPDNAAVLSGSVRLDKVLHAYGEKNMGALWLIEIEDECSLRADESERLLYLEAMLPKVSTALVLAAEEKNALMDLPLWQIQERVYDADIAGQDLLGEIAARIEAKIAATQQNQEVFVA